MSNQEINIWLRLKGDLSKGINKISQYFSSFAKSFTRDFASIHFMIKDALRIMQEGWRQLETVTKIDQQRTAFRNLANSYGADSRKIVEDLKKASGETLSTIDIMTQASKAMTLGLNPEQFGKLMEISRASARAMGEDVDFMFQSIVLGIGRQSKMILDNLGIIVKAEEAYENYAEKLGKTKEELTDAEKRQAFMNAAIEAGEDIIKKVNIASENRAEQLQKISSSLTNIKNNLANIAAQKVNLQGIANTVNDLSTSIERSKEQSDLLQGSWQLEAMADRVKDLRGAIMDVQGENMMFGVNQERIELLQKYREEIDAIMQTAREMNTVTQEGAGQSEETDPASAISEKVKAEADLNKKILEERKKLTLAKKLYNAEDLKDAKKTAELQMEFEETMYAQGKQILAMAAEDSKAAAIAYQAVLIGESIMSTAMAVVKALEIYGPTPFGFAMATAAGVLGASKTAIIASQGFAEGTDSVPSMLTPGEMVVPRTFAQAIRSGDLTLSGAGGGSQTNINIEMYNPVITNDEVANDIVNKIIEEVSYVLNRESERV